MERKLAIILVLASAFIALSFAIGFIILSYATVTLCVNLFCYSLLLIATYPIKTLATLAVILIMLLSYRIILNLLKK
jgi:hypothetical protein